MPAIPTIFLGSSNETEELTAALTKALRACGRIKVLPWYEAFDAGFGALEDLAKRVNEVDFAAFLLMPEDQLKVRDQTHPVPRDNVIFELGLFMGRLNRDRTFALVEDPAVRGQKVKLPSDFNGVTQVRYGEDAATDLARKLLPRIKKLGPLRGVPVGTHVVEGGADGRNVHSTISSALEVAGAGDVILVRPGVYSDPLIIDKPVELIGVGVMDADADRAIIRTPDSTAVIYKASAGHGRIATMTIEGGGSGMCGLDVIAGRLTVRGCQFGGRAQLEACVRVRGDGDATLHASVIRDSEGVGVLVCENGDARIVANRIARHTHSCVEVRDGAHPEIRANRISSGAGGGIWIHGGSRGEVELNEIFDHALAGVTITDGADPRVRANRIYKCRGAGIYISGGGRGTVSDNDVYGNIGTGIEIDNGSDVLVERNRVYDGLGGGVLVADGGRAHIRDNHVRANRRAGAAFLAGSGPVHFQGNTVMDGGAEGVYDEMGISERDNHVLGNAAADWCRPDSGS